MMQKVSLITPVYNAMPYLKDYLDSLRNQTWRPLELIFADDGSTDDSVDQIKRYIPIFEEAGISVKLLELPHRSQADAVNDALKEVTGELLTWCDADDIMENSCVEKKAVFLQEHPEIGIVRNDGLHIDGDTGKIISSNARECDRTTQNIFYDLLWQNTYCYAGCYMVRMSLFDECYPDRSIPVSPEGQNLQLLLPPASRSVCGFIPELLHRYYQRSTGHSSRGRSYTEQRKRILNFSDLFRRILPYCECDRDYYEKEICRIEQEKMEQLHYSALIRIRREIRHESGNTDTV